MSDLLDLAVKAHGGLQRWNKVKSVNVAAAITGAIWFLKSKGDALNDVAMVIDAKRERLVMDFPARTSAPPSSRPASSWKRRMGH